MLELTLRLVFSLAAVVGLLLVLAKISSKRFAGRHGAALQVLHRQALSRSAGVSLVTVGERVLLLGVTEQQVSLLAELDPDELPDLPYLLEVDAAEPVAAPGAVPQAAEGLPVEPPLLTTVGKRALRPPAKHAAAPAPTGLGGSVLSPQTWRQAYAAATRRAS